MNYKSFKKYTRTKGELISKLHFLGKELIKKETKKIDGCLGEQGREDVGLLSRAV